MKRQGNQTREASLSWRSADHVNLAVHLRRTLRHILSRWIVVAVACSIGVIIGIVRAISRPDIYRATSELEVRPKVQHNFSSRLEYLEVLDGFYDNQLRLMQSSPVLKAVQERMAGYQFTHGTIPVTKATASRGRGSSFQLVVEGTDFTCARQYATEWAREFIRFKNARRDGTIVRSIRATMDGAANHEKKLAGVRQKLVSFLERNARDGSSQTGESSQRLLERLLAEQTRIATERRLLEHASREELAHDPAFQQQSPEATDEGTQSERSGPREGSDPLDKFQDTGYAQLKVERRVKEVEKSKWQQTLRPEHPFLKGLEDELLAIDRKLQFQLDLIEEKRQALIQSHRKREEGYEVQINEQRRLTIQAQSRQQEFEALKAEEEFLRSNLENHRKTIQTYELSVQDEGQFDIIEEGIGRPVPIGSERPAMVATSGALGLAIGVALALLLGRLDDRLAWPEQIERDLEEPILGELPLIQSPRSGQWVNRLASPDEAPLFWESVRRVRSALLLSQATPAHRLILVTSAIPGDGKTTFSVHFAAVLAAAGHRVLLLDADLRRGNVHGYFEHEREPGLAELLAGSTSWRQALQPTDVPNLQVISSGAISTVRSEMLGGAALKGMMEVWRREFDYIIVDSPPVTAMDDTFAVGANADGILFVVRAGSTPLRLARAALSATRQRNIRVLGLVVNALADAHSSYYYDYYYSRTHPDSPPALRGKIG